MEVSQLFIASDNIFPIIFRKDELRLKSNADLHKLWFVLLKERNMLLTMEVAYKDKFAPMPNPERVDKVELSMEHLEEVVRERNRAYWELEVGVSGERERVYRKDCFGRLVPYKLQEHAVPIWMNRSYRNKLKFRFQNSGRADVIDFKARLAERETWIEQKQELLQMRSVKFDPYLLKETIRKILRLPEFLDDSLTVTWRLCKKSFLQ